MFFNFFQFPKRGPTVSFELVATFKNPGPDYLSAGQSPLPQMYFAFSIMFFRLTMCQQYPSK